MSEKPLRFSQRRRSAVNAVDAPASHLLLFLDDVLDLHEEPRIDVRELVRRCSQRPARAERIAHVQQAVRARRLQLVGELVVDSSGQLAA